MTVSVNYDNYDRSFFFFFFFITLGLELSDTKSLRALRYEPSLELLRNTAEQLFSNRELYRSLQRSFQSTMTVSATLAQILRCVPATALQGYLAHKKQPPPPRTTTRP